MSKKNAGSPNAINLSPIPLFYTPYDALRKQRNVADYSGDIVPTSAVEECVSYAEALLNSVADWLQDNKPELFWDEKG